MIRPSVTLSCLLMVYEYIYITIKILCKVLFVGVSPRIALKYTQKYHQPLSYTYNCYSFNYVFMQEVRSRHSGIAQIIILSNAFMSVSFLYRAIMNFKLYIEKDFRLHHLDMVILVILPMMQLGP